MKNKILSLFLVFSLLIGIIPNSVMAKSTVREDDDNKVEITSNETKNINGKIYKIFEVKATDLNNSSSSKDDHLNSINDRVRKAGDDLFNWKLKIDWIGREGEFPFPEQGITIKLIKAGTETPYGEVTYKAENITDKETGFGEEINFKEVEGVDPNELGDSVKLGIPDHVNYDPQVFLEGTPKEGYTITASFKQKVNPLFKSEWHISTAEKPEIDAYVLDIDDRTKTMEFCVPLEDNIYSIYDTQATRFWDGTKLVDVTTGREANQRDKNKRYDGKFPLNSVLLGRDAEPAIEFGYGDTEYKNETGFEEIGGKKYLLNVYGDHQTMKRFAVYEALKVKFNTGEGKLEGGQDKADIGKAQEIGYSEKIANNESGRTVDIPTETITPPKTKVGDKEVDATFAGWATEEQTLTDGKLSDVDETKLLVDANGGLTKAGKIYTFTKDETTLYAVFEAEKPGKVNINYVDDKGNDLLKAEPSVKVDDEGYPEDKTGVEGKVIEAALTNKSKAPKFIGYKINSVKLQKGNQDTTDQIKYTKNGDYTVVFVYEKLDDVIPEKGDDGQPNPKVTEDVKKTYIPVTWKVDSEKGEFKKGETAVAGTEFTYYVNPTKNKTFSDVVEESGLTAASKDENKYKIDTENPCTFNPNKVKANEQEQAPSLVVDNGTEINKLHFTVEKGLVVTVNFEQTKADQFKDKLDPETIKVWVGDTINWKNGVKLKEANDKLQGILDDDTTVVTDESNRDSSKQNLPEGKEGTLKVTFSDGSSINVEKQMLYVADHKVPIKDGDDTNKIDPKNLPDDKLEVKFLLGEGVKIGDKEGDKATPVLYTTYYVKPGTDLKEDAPEVTLKEGFKDAKWYKGDAVATDADYKVTANVEFTAKATGKDKVVKLDDPENPTNFPKDPKDNRKNDADYVTVKFVADENGKIKEGDAEKTKGIAYAVLKNTEWADAVKAGVVVPEKNATENNPKLVGKDKFHSFKEWQKDGTKVTEFAKVGDTNVTYTAVFGKANELSVTYNLNAPEGLTVGGTAPTDDTKYLKDEEVTVKALAADNKLAGYEFKGWNTQADGKGTAYAADAKFAIKADTELFAQWKKTAPDVIPVDNDTDQKGKKGEEIPTNYVFVEFKVKDDDAEKAGIKDGQQAKFKVDPKATVTLTAPELEVKDAYKVSHTAKFNEADYTNKVFAKATTIWASVSEKGKIEVKYVFETNPKNKNLPEALAALKPTDLKDGTAVYPENAPVDPTAPDTSSKEAQKALVERDAKDKKLGEWKAGNWKKDVDKNTGNITYILTWTFEEVGKSKTPDVNPVKPGDKKITGKGEPGSDIEVKIPDKDDPIKTTVEKNGDWTIDVPEDKKLKDGDKVIVTQTEKDKKTSDPVEKTVTEDKKPEPKPEPKPVPEVEIPGIKYKDHKVPTYPVYVSVPDKKVPVQDIFTHEQYIFGYPDDTIRPDGDMTRAEAIAVVARLRKLDLSDKTSNIYKDTKAGMWYNAAINAAFREGYLLEKEGENIRPNDKITRAELALLISHIDKKNDTVAPFEDVKGHKFEAAINQAYGNERIKGYPDGTFKPDNSITRAEVATMLNKLYDRYPDKNYIDANQNLVHNYKDMSYKGHWGYYELVEAYHTHKFARLANNMEEWKAIIK